MRTETPSTRFHSLDALRAVAMLLGVTVHATHSFFIDMWAGIADVSRSYIILPALYMYIHQFRLHAFFVIAGFFAHMLYHRDGPARMLKARAQRILIPFGIGMAILIPMVHAVQEFGRARAMAPDAPIPWMDIYDHFASGAFLESYATHYLWFLYYLFLYYLIFTVGRPLVTKIDARLRLSEHADDWVKWICNRAKAPLVLAAVSLIPMSLMQGPMVDEPGFSLLPQLGPLLFYGMFFWFGWMLHRQTQRLHELKRYWKTHLISGTTVYLIIAGAMITAFLIIRPDLEAPNPQETEAVQEETTANEAIASLTPDGAESKIIENSDNAPIAGAEIDDASPALEPPSSPHGPPPMPGGWGAFAAYSVIRFITAFLMWSLTLGVIGLFLTFFERQSPLFRYIADSAYWLYLAHAPLIMLIQIWIAYWPLHWSIKFVLIHLFLLAPLFLAYHFLVRGTWVGVMLNGRRLPLTAPWRTTS